jgi:hypothetical protein
VSVFNTPGLRIFDLWHNGDSGVNTAVNPDGGLRLSFTAQLKLAGHAPLYVATMTLISRASGKQYHYPIPASWRADIGNNQVIYQLLWARAANATGDEKGLFLFQPTIVFLNQAEVDTGYQTELRWAGFSEFAIAEEPHYLLMEGPPPK